MRLSLHLVLLWHFWRVVGYSDNVETFATGVIPISLQPGPKSGAPRMTHLNIHAKSFIPCEQGEGCEVPTDLTGTASIFPSIATAVNQRGTGPNMGLTPHQPRLTNKRSYIRACRRALTDGVSWHQGHCITPAAVPAHIQPIPPLHTKTGRNTSSGNSIHAPRNRLTILHWNCSGLSSARYHETLKWLDALHLDAIIISETHWGLQQEWETPYFWALHSGTFQDKSDGLLVLLSKRLCPSRHVAWSEPCPGRLAHIRIFGTQRSVDIVACYQHVYTGTNASLQLRKKFWIALEKLLGGLPKRNGLILAGDFNTSIPFVKHLVGSTRYRWNSHSTCGSTHPDAGALGDIIRQFQLSALNTFTTTGPTYVHTTHSSRIDYIMTRHHQSDGMSKQITMLPQATILGDSQVHHIPMIAY